MIRVLFIARYRDATMHHKVELMAAEPDLEVRQVLPRRWQDEHLSVIQASSQSGRLRRTALEMLGRPSDPHRAIYRTLDFGLRAWQPDIIHAEEEPDSLAAAQIALARRLFAPWAKLLLFTWQNLPRPLRPEVAAVTRTALRAADAVLCASHEAAEVLRARGYRRPTPVIQAVGVDVRLFTPGPPRPADGRFRVGYLGRLVPEKGLETLIAAVARLAREPGPAPELRLIGSGPHRAALEQCARAEGVESAVCFTPSLPPAAVPAALRELDALVLPSRTTPTWKEQFGRALTEAMACRVAVVGADSGAIPEVIGEAGLIFPEGDAGALADCLLRLRADPDWRHRLALAGEARVRAHYTQPVLAARTAALYRELSR